MTKLSTQTIMVTPQGLERLQWELEHLRTVKRREIAARLHDVVEDGEIEENAAYDALKTEQAFVEGRIVELESLLGRARLIQPLEEGDTIGIGSSVELLDVDGVVERYMIVGVAESDPREGRISYASPLGNALLNRVCGENVTFMTPDGIKQYQILSILPVGITK